MGGEGAEFRLDHLTRKPAVDLSKCETIDFITFLLFL